MNPISTWCLALAALVFCLAQPATAQLAAPPKAQTSAAVLAAEAAYNAAVVANDIPRAASYLTADYSFSVPEGAVISKEKFLKDMHDFWKPLSITATQQQVKMAGNAAIVTGLAAYRWRHRKGYIQQQQENYTDTYLWQGGGWKRWASHTSRFVAPDSARQAEISAQLDITRRLTRATNTDSALALLDPYYHEGHIDAYMTGGFGTKKDVFDWYRSNKIQNDYVLKIKTLDSTITLFGDVALINRRFEDQTTRYGQTRRIEVRETKFLQYNYGYWQQLGIHHSLIPTPRPALRLDLLKAQKLVGRYRQSEGKALVVSIESNRLFAEAAPQPKVELQASDENGQNYYVPGSEGEYIFILGPQGQPTHLRQRTLGQDYIFPKVK